MIDRRNFLRQSAIFLAATRAGALLAGTTRSKKYRMGLQLYTVREPMARAPVAALQAIAAYGYEDLETYGYEPETNRYYGMPAADFKMQMADRGLVTSSGHYDLFLFLNRPVEEQRRYLDQCIAGAHALGQRFITWPWLDPESRTIEKFKLLAERLNLAGEQVAKAGLGFAYHNHDFEFIDQGGETGYQVLLRDTDPVLVKWQIDLYWAKYASPQSPHELFLQQPGRFAMWHLKDMHKVSRDYTELGNGSIDYARILPDAPLAGMQYYFIEQGGNFARDPMQSIADSAAYFRQHLEKWLA
jgi:sugar phosphate isomerase/epimerase